MGGATRFLMLLNTTNPFPLLHHRCPSLLRLSRHRKLLSSPRLYRLTATPSPFPSPPTKASHQQLHTRSSAALRDDHLTHFSNLPPHLWPEWSTLLHNLSLAGYFNDTSDYRSGSLGIGGEDEFVAAADLPDEFVRAAGACFAFARDRAGDLGLLSKRDIEVVVEHGAPFLFKNGDVSVRRMRSFLGNGESNVLDTDKALTVDLMKFILSYASNPSVSSEINNFENEELVESSVRSLLREFAKLSYSISESNTFGTLQNQSPDRFGQTPTPVGRKVEMKRGDWICPRCNFMNFARNMKCFDCEEARPKRQLTGGEWECPQCDFFNYGRNMVCLRCHL